MLADCSVLKCRIAIPGVVIFYTTYYQQSNAVLEIKRHIFRINNMLKQS